MKTLEENLAQLPKNGCYGVLNSTGELIHLKPMQLGYDPISLTADGSIFEGEIIDTNDKLADALNRERGVTKAQRSAMQWGSIWGYDHGLSDASRYDDNGKLILNTPVASLE